MQLRKTIKSNLEEVEHLTKLSTMLLELSHSEKNSVLNTAPVDFIELVKCSIAKSIESERFDLEAPPSLFIVSQELALREICQILIDNSLKHSPPDSPIRVSIEVKKQQVIWQISNSSYGANQDQLEHAFERFNSNPKTGGYGLGLPLARQLIEALGGKISISAEDDDLVVLAIIMPQK